ncbi:MAG: response regulator transcription factor [Oscillospiraceae bacterium]|nr:response regulator transcription factor [Oscillospiraceae bacterium]
MEKLLLVEDDPDLIPTLSAFLQGEGFRIISATGQTQAASALCEQQPDLALVDISLQEGNGFGVCRQARELNIPVIFLTACGDEFSVVAGLDMGADDYIAKPFRPRELVSRIRSVLRRNGRQKSLLTVGDIVLDPDKGTVSKRGRAVFLSALEYKLLLLLLQHKGQLLSRDRLLEEIWDSGGEFVNDNTLTVYMKRLREKLEDDPGKPRYIKTLRGLGYRLEEDGC